MPQPQPTDAPSRPRRHRFTFSLPTLFLVITLIGFALGWYIVPRPSRHAVVVAIQQAGGNILFEATPDDEAWHRKLLRQYVPQDWLDDVIGIYLLDRDSDLAAIKTEWSRFPTLGVLQIENNAFTDADLVHLQGLANLQTLMLSGNKITGPGLVHLHGLPQLHMLVLSSTPIDDSGLVHLRGISQLRVLNLTFTAVTDAGLTHLKDLRNLTKLEVSYTAVTQAGENNLRTALPNCTFSH